MINMIKSPLRISTLALTAALLVATPLKAKEKIVIDLKPTTGWATTMIEAPSPSDSYCALTRQYDQGLVFTLGQNTRDEYSLAFDFQNEKLNTDKPYKINLQPGPGQLRAYEILPASLQALVVRLGYDENFLQALEKSNELKAEIDGKNYLFSMDNLAKGKSELNNCIVGLTGESVTKTAANFSAEKIENAEPIKDIVQPLVEQVVEAPSEVIQAVKKPKAISIPAPEKVATKKIVEEKVAENKITEKVKQPPPVVEAVVAPEPIILKAKEPKLEIAQPKKTETPKKEIQISRIDSQKFSPVTPKAEMPVVEAPKVEALAVVTEALPEAIVAPEPVIVKAVPKETKVAVVEAPAVKKEPAEKELKSATRVSVAPDVKSSSRPQIIAATKKNYGSRAAPKKTLEQNKETSTVETLGKAVEKPVNVKKEPVKPEVIVEATAPVEEIVMPAKQAREKAAQKAQNPQAPQILAETKERQSSEIKTAKKVDPAPRPPEATSLKADIAVSNANDAKKIAADKRSAEAELELQKVQQKLKELEKENYNLYQDAKKARGQIDTAVVETGNEALKKIRSYEKRLEAAQADNLALSKEIENMRRLQEDVQVNALAGDPSSQQSLKRYNEAEREIKRLGLLLEQQRLSHNQEKEELEELLFDPAVTDQAQRKKLADLEAKLAQAEKRLQAEAQKVNRVDPAVQQRLQEMELRLAESKKKEAQLKAEQQTLKAKQQAINLEAQKKAQKLEAVRLKEKELAAAALALENKRKAVAEAEAKLVDVRRKEQEIKAAEEKMRIEAQKIAEAEARVNAQRIEADKKQREAQALAERQAVAKRQAEETRQAAAKRQAAEKLIAAQNNRVAKSPVAQAISAPTKAVSVVPTRAAVAAPASIPSFGQSNIQQLLNQSGLSSVSSVRQQAAGRYAWNAAGMTGKAQVSNAGQNLSQFAQSYIAQEKRGCQGDFASLPARVPTGQQGFEIACVGSNGGKSASVVFAKKGSSLIAITHETTADNMDAAIDARDKVASRL